MEPAGMVHALEKIYQLLEPDGLLIDLHPLFDAPIIEVRIGSQTYLGGWMRETNDRIEYEQADAALAEIVKRRRFVTERQSIFEYHIHAKNSDELQEYLAENWKDAIVDDVVLMRIDDLMKSIEADQEIVVREKVRIARLRPLRPGA